MIDDRPMYNKRKTLMDERTIIQRMEESRRNDGLTMRWRDNGWTVLQLHSIFETRVYKASIDDLLYHNHYARDTLGEYRNPTSQPPTGFSPEDYHPRYIRRCQSADQTQGAGRRSQSLAPLLCDFRRSIHLA